MSIKTLISKGCVELNKCSDIPDKRTVVVLGTARGGTSIVAGSLYHLGLPMFGACSPVYEDVKLSSAFEDNDNERYRTIIKEYNVNDVWAWKRPSSINYLDIIEAEVRNPFYVVIMRDVLSVGLRNGLSMGHDLIPSIKAAQEQQRILVDFVANTRSPVLMLSVEKIKQYPNNFIATLTDFINVTPSQNQIERAIEFIEPEPMEYIEASRVNRSHGQIGGMKKKLLHGWASWMYRSEAVVVELSINGAVRDTVSATDWREHGKDNPSLRNGYCGYQFDLSKYTLKVGDIISVRVKGEVRDLKNSPITVTKVHL